MTPDQTVCAEYLALTIARRRGYGVRDAERVAALVGLPITHVATVLRSASLEQIEARRALLRGLTGFGGQMS
jgi:hypothetical protein